jgi:hypothetical protein
VGRDLRDGDGETTIGPSLIVTVPAGLTSGAPTAGAPTTGGSIELGSFTYTITYGTPSGRRCSGRRRTR